ncbi:MAG: hypothetical protein RI945_251 [Candidatus Parcubacteria bacterium]|jgi:N-acetylmuramoyl-L-alanine amidase CwlA
MLIDIVILLKKDIRKNRARTKKEAESFSNHFFVDDKKVIPYLSL